MKKKVKKKGLNMNPGLIRMTKNVKGKMHKCGVHPDCLDSYIKKGWTINNEYK